MGIYAIVNTLERGRDVIYLHEIFTIFKWREDHSWHGKSYL